jgi:hypothetical protein
MVTKRNALIDVLGGARASRASRAVVTDRTTRHVPGGELLRDDGGHLDFRLMCLKRVVCVLE